jgi:hypothetical protein
MISKLQLAIGGFCSLVRGPRVNIPFKQFTIESRSKNANPW